MQTTDSVVQRDPDERVQSQISYELMKSFKHSKHTYDMGTITYGVLTPGFRTVSKYSRSVTPKSHKADDEEEEATAFFSGVLTNSDS